MGRPTKLNPATQERITSDDDLLAIVRQTADFGNADAQAWLRGEGYIHITDYPHRSFFVRFTNQFERYSSNARLWTRRVYQRDKYTCQECGQVGGELNAHHVKSWAEFPELRYDLDNGITLCASCHARKHPHLRLFQSGKKRAKNKANRTN